MSKTPEEMYQEREQRIMDTVALKQTDRPPILIAFTYFPAIHCNIKKKAAWYDHDAWFDATMKTIQDYHPDGIWSIQGFTPGAAQELLNPRTQRWPGFGLDDDNEHQAIEVAGMHDGEYEEYFADKGDFALRKMVGRFMGTAEPFSKLPPLQMLTSGFGATMFAEALAEPDVAEAIEKFQKAGRILKELRPKMKNFYAEAEALGYPCPMGVGGGAPFDAVSDYLRGMQGAMIDMYRNPKELLRLVEERFDETIERLDALPVATKPMRALMPLHRGSDGFMSLKQFEKFYWPYLRDIMLKMIEKGITPFPFLEGTWDQRLNYLKDLPKGKAVAHFAYSDMKKAKDVLGGHLCIMGDVPSSHLNTGTAEGTAAYVKDLMEYCGKDGTGLIVANNTINQGKPECVKAMIDTVLEYRY